MTRLLRAGSENQFSPRTKYDAVLTMSYPSLQDSCACCGVKKIDTRTHKRIRQKSSGIANQAKSVDREADVLRCPDTYTHETPGSPSAVAACIYSRRRAKFVVPIIPILHSTEPPQRLAMFDKRRIRSDGQPHP